MADELDFLELIIASERVSQWIDVLHLGTDTIKCVDRLARYATGTFRFLLWQRPRDDLLINSNSNSDASDSPPNKRIGIAVIGLGCHANA